MRIIESTFDYPLPKNCKLRVWRNETEIGLKVHTDIKNIADNIDAYPSMQAFIEAVCTMPRVSAVQFINAHGNGFVVYTEWP